MNHGPSLVTTGYGDNPVRYFFNKLAISPRP